MTTTIVCGMDVEASIARSAFPKSQIIQFQHTPAYRLEDHVLPSCRRIWSFGLCGGNAPGFPVAAIGVARSLVDQDNKQYAVDPEMRASIIVAARNAGMNIGVCPWLSTTTMNMGIDVASRAGLLERFGAWAVDDETYYAANWANDHGVPFGVVRSCSDDWRMNLPPLVNGALNADGSMNDAFVEKQLLGNPGQLPAVLKTLDAYVYSSQTLRYAARVLSAAMED